MIKKQFTLLFLLIAGITIGMSTDQSLSTNTNQAITGRGNALALQQKYNAWKTGYERNNGAKTLSLPLGFAKAFASTQTSTGGLATIDLLTGNTKIKLSGLTPGEKYSFWLIGGNKHDASTVEKQITEFTADSEHHLLTVQLDRHDLQGIYINKVAISLAKQNTATPMLLTGSPSLFQRIYYNDMLWTVAGVGQTAKTPQQETPFSFLLPKPAFASNPNADLEAVLGEQIALGRDLFLNETFDGNGRTCGTCHRPENNHTIDPKFIANLPDDDPLFIAENNPDLAELENPALLRQFGLILANIDGFDQPGVFRGVPHLLALTTSITPEIDKEEGLVINAIGWSADGAPGDGSLRMFSVGAVTQHMPKTLNRVEDVDFRLPTEEELDAMEAYQLSLGRTHDMDLDNMFFSSPVVQHGRELFHSKTEGGMCKGCHFNGGGNSSTSLQNGNRDTGIENLPDLPARLVWAPTPVDGGFGIEEASDCGWDQGQDCLGNKEFNMTTVIEAADTAPFFHNNAVTTIEEAVAFYNSNAFHRSPGAKPIDHTLTPPRETCERCIHLESTQVVSVALFLRTINAMENIRSSNEMLDQVMQLNRRNGREILKLAIAETTDAIEVLEGGQVIANPDSLKLLKRALKLEKKATKRRVRSRKRNRLLNRAINLKLDANDLLLTDAPA